MAKHTQGTTGDGHKSGGYDHSKTKSVEDAGGGKHSKDDRGNDQKK